MHSRDWGNRRRDSRGSEERGGAHPAGLEKRERGGKKERRVKGTSKTTCKQGNTTIHTFYLLYKCESKKLCRCPSDVASLAVSLCGVSVPSPVCAAAALTSRNGFVPSRGPAPSAWTHALVAVFRLYLAAASTYRLAERCQPRLRHLRQPASRQCEGPPGCVGDARGRRVARCSPAAAAAL